MKERMQLVSLFDTGKYTVTELAQQFEVSRKTAHKWIGRYEKSGLIGLDDLSRAPYTQPGATPENVVKAVIAAKLAHPTWGPAKLLPDGRVAPEIARAWPPVSTRGRILAQRGLTKHRRRRRRVTPWTEPFVHADSPNAVWCADFKGYFRTADGKRCDPLTVTDAYSRMLLCCEIVPRTDYTNVRRAFEKVFREHGLPCAIRTDNGAPFASLGVAGLSRLSAWWIRLGILPERIDPGHPEQNGRHERMHRTLKESTLCPPASNHRSQQRRFDEFRLTYNTVRPHQAIGQVPPAHLHRPSPSAYPRQARELVYPALTVQRRVRSNGQIKWQGALIFIGEALVGQRVGIRATEHGWLVLYGPIPLGLLRPEGRALDRFPRNPATTETKISVTHVIS